MILRLVVWNFCLLKLELGGFPVFFIG
uniref:Uncharacterized protein n=1 Tax=Rhizophora mucronata TaxID=61149 RepID=A0A2P2N464_RHIMU